MNINYANKIEIINLLRELFFNMINYDNEINLLKNDLYLIPEFDPIILFNLLDTKKKFKLNYLDLYNLLTENNSSDININKNHLKLVLRMYSIKMELNIEKFNQLISFNFNRSNNIINYQNNIESNEIYIKNIFKEIILKEIELIKSIENKVNELIDVKDFNSFECFNIISNNKKYITKDDLIRFINNNVTEEEIIKLYFRLNLNKNQYFDYKEFQELLFPFQHHLNFEEVQNSNNNIINLNSNYLENKSNIKSLGEYYDISSNDTNNNLEDNIYNNIKENNFYNNIIENNNFNNKKELKKSFNANNINKNSLNSNINNIKNNLNNSYNNKKYKNNNYINNDNIIDVEIKKINIKDLNDFDSLNSETSSSSSEEEDLNIIKNNDSFDSNDENYKHQIKKEEYKNLLNYYNTIDLNEILENNERNFKENSYETYLKQKNEKLKKELDDYNKNLDLRAKTQKLFDEKYGIDNIENENNKYEIMEKILKKSNSTKLQLEYFNQIIQLEKIIDNYKEQICLLKDATPNDLFNLIVDNKDFITKNDFKFFLEKKAGIFFKEIELDLFFKKFNLNDNNYFNFNQFINLILPINKNYHKILFNKKNENKSKGLIISFESKKIFFDFITQLIKNEIIYYNLKAKLNTKLNFNCSQTWRFITKFSNNDFIVLYDLKKYLEYNQMFLTSYELNLLFNKFDRYKKGIVYYEDYIIQIKN